MHNVPGPGSVRGSVSGFVVAEDQGISLEKLRAGVSSSVLLADVKLHGGEAISRLRAEVLSLAASVLAWTRGGLAARNAIPPALIPATHAPAWQSYFSGVGRGLSAGRDFLIGMALFAVLFVFMFRPFPRRRRKLLVATRASMARRYVVFHCGILGVLAALGAAVLIPERDGEPTFTPITPLQASTGSELLRASQPGDPATAEPRTSFALSFSPLDTLPWVMVRKPIAMFNLEGPETEGAELEYRVFTRGPSARQDSLTFTPKPAQVANKPRVHLVVERFEGSHPTQKPLFADLAARAADRRATLDRMSAPSEFPTKFGAVQVADAVLKIDGAPQGCLVFRRVDMAGITFAGWYCGAPKRVASRVELTCFLNRLDLIGAGSDVALKRLFAEAERQRVNCINARQAGRKITWLDHEAPVPSLKLNAKAR